MGDDGRVTTVLLHLQYAFEMLLKAALDSKGVKLFDKHTGESIFLESAVRRCQYVEGSDLSDEEAGTIRVIDSLRDAEQHWYTIVDEGLLCLHVRAGVTLFDDLLQRVFREHLAGHVPVQVLPVSAEPPQDLQILVDREYERVANLLKPGRRGGGDAKARIRTSWAMESLTDPDAAEVREGDVRRVERFIREGKSRDQVCPKLGGMTSTLVGNGLTVGVRMVKKGGLPVTHTVDASAEAAAIRLVDLEKKFHMSPYGLADRSGVPRVRSTALRRHLGIDANDDHFSHKFVFGSQKHLRYSDNALRAMKEAVKTVDMEKVWVLHRTAPSSTRIGKFQPVCDQPGCVLLGKRALHYGCVRPVGLTPVRDVAAGSVRAMMVLAGRVWLTALLTPLARGCPVCDVSTGPVHAPVQPGGPSCPDRGLAMVPIMN